MDSTGREIAKEFRKTMQCNCDLDNWEPERNTGHSCVCRIHKATNEVLYRGAPNPLAKREVDRG